MHGAEKENSTSPTLRSLASRLSLYWLPHIDNPGTLTMLPLRTLHDAAESHAPRQPPPSH